MTLTAARIATDISGAAVLRPEPLTPLDTQALEILRAHTALSAVENSSGHPIDLAARVLDEINPQLEERRIGDLLHAAGMNASARSSFYAAIEKRAALAGRIFIGEHPLAWALRRLLGVSEHLVADHVLLNSLPNELLDKLRRALVCVVFPGDTRPNATPTEVSADQLRQAMMRTKKSLTTWRDDLMRRMLLPITQNLHQARIAEHEHNNRQAIKLVQLSPEAQAAALDELDATGEDALRFCAQRDASQGAEYLGITSEQWLPLRAHLQHREAASGKQPLPVAALHAALGHIRPQWSAAEVHLGCLLMQPILLNRLQSSIGSSLYIGCDSVDSAIKNALVRLEKTGILEQHLQQVSKLARDMQQTAPQAWALLDYLLSRLLETPNAQLQTPLPSLATHIQAGALKQGLNSDRPLSRFFSALSEQCQQSLEAHAAHWQNTPCRLWLRHARLTAQRLGEQCAALQRDLHDMGICGIQPLEKSLVAGALNGNALADAGGNAFAHFSGADPAQQGKIKDSLLQKNGKTTRATLDKLKQMRSSNAPARAALCALVESLANRMRAQKAHSAVALETNEDDRLIQAAIEDAQANQSPAPADTTIAKIESTLDKFLESMQTTGSLAKRADAITKKLGRMSAQEIIQLGCALLHRQLHLEIRNQIEPYRKRSGTVDTILRGTLPRLSDIGEISEQQHGLTTGELRKVINEYVTQSSEDPRLDKESPQLIARRAPMCTERLTSYVLSIKKGRSTAETHQQNLEYAGYLGVASYLGLSKALRSIPVLGTLAHSIWGSMLDLYADTMPDNVTAAHAIDNVGLIYPLGDQVFNEHAPRLAEALADARTHPQLAEQVRGLMNVSTVEIRRGLRNSVANEALGYVAATLLGQLGADSRQADIR